MYDSMVFYRSFYEAVKNLPLEAQSKVYSAIFAYGLDGEEIELEGIEQSIFTLVKPLIDANNRRKENGKKGGRPSKEKNLDLTETKPNQNLDITKEEPKQNLTKTKPEPKPNLDQTEAKPNVICNMLNVKGNMEKEDIKEKNIRKESPKTKLAESRKGKTKYGDEVYLSDDEYMKLVREHGQEAANKMISMLDGYKVANGKQYFSDYRAILNWVVDEFKKRNKTSDTIVDKWRNA